MADLYAFPHKGIRQWAVFADGLEKVLAEKGVPGDLIAETLETLRPAALDVFESDGVAATPGDNEATVKAVNGYLTNVVMGLLLHMANLAIDRHLLRKDLEAAKAAGPRR